MAQESRTTEEINKLGEEYYKKGYDLYSTDEDQAYYYIQESLSFVSAEQNPELHAKANNMLGIISTHREDYSTAINQLSSCLSICYSHNIPFFAGLSASNLGFLFQNIGNYDKAISYYEQAVDFFRADNTHDNFEEYRATLLTNIFNCYYRLDDHAAMSDILTQMRSVQELIDPSFSMSMYEAIYAKSIGDSAGMKKNIDECLSKFFEEKELADYIDICQFLCEFLYDNGLFAPLGKVLEFIDTNIPDAIFPRIRIELVKYKMAYYESIGDSAQYIAAAKEYVSLYETITKIFHKSISESVLLGLELKEMEKGYKEFEKKADTDALTQLLNRNGMIEKVSPLLTDAQKTRTLVSVFIVDIDYFKQYNDHYGHVLGDECIKKVAKVLKSSFDNSSFVCRYGGDEFTAFCHDMSEVEAQAAGDKIVQAVCDLRIESVDSPISENVSVSVGFFTGIPSESESLEDLIDHADKGLYTAKERGRNRACCCG